MKTPIQNRDVQARCSTPPTVSPSRSKLMNAAFAKEDTGINPFYNLIDKMNEKNEDADMAQNIHESLSDSIDPLGNDLYKRLVAFNEEMDEKAQDLISIRMQLQTLENNINAQVDEFVKSLSISQVNLQARFIEVQRYNEELRKIKDFILNSNLQSNTFTYKKILKTLQIKSIEEISNIEALK